MKKLDANCVRVTTARFDQFCELNAEQGREEADEGTNRYATEYLGFTEDGLEALRQYMCSDDEIVAATVAFGRVVPSMFLAGLMLGAAIRMEAEADPPTDVEVPDPDDFK